MSMRNPIPRKRSFKKICPNCRRKFLSSQSAKRYCSAECHFWYYVEKSPACWIWTGSRFPSSGYGRFSTRRGQVILAHRFSYELHNGSIPEGLWILHKCDNPPCVRPSHLFPGTPKVNSLDMSEKGRSARGEKGGLSKLTDQDVLQIRSLLVRGQVTQRKLAKRFAVSNQLISQIHLRRIWTHL